MEIMYIDRSTNCAIANNSESGVHESVFGILPQF